MYYKNNNSYLYYKKYGNSKKIILILPGWGDTRQTFDYLINCLKENYTIYIIDWPGFGNSDFPNINLTVYDYTNIIISFMKDLNIINPIIIAHSFGGRITSLLAGYYKIKLDKLILIDIAGIKPKKSIIKRLKSFVYKLLKKLSILIPKRKRNIYLKKVFKYFASSDYKQLDNNMYQTFKNIVNEDLKYTYKNIKQETLIIWGENDDATPLQDGIYINNNIANSELIVYQDAGHFSYLDYPYLTYDIIYEFLKK